MKFKILKFKTLIFVFLLFIFCFLPVALIFAQENNSDKIIGLREQIQELERQSAEYKKLITQKQQEGTTLKRELAILENQIVKLRVNILTTNRRVELTGLEIQDLNAEILKTEAKINKNKESVSELLRRLDSVEKQDLAAVVLANPRISHFFNYLQYLNNLQGQLIANLNAFIELKNELGDRKKETESKKQQRQGKSFNSAKRKQAL